MRLGCYERVARPVRTAGTLALRLRSDARSSRCARCFAKFHMDADEIDAQIRMLAAERRLPPSHLARWLAMDQPSRAALLDIARVLRLRTGQLVTALDTLEEIAVREHRQHRRDSRPPRNSPDRCRRRFRPVARQRAPGGAARAALPAPEKDAGAVAR